MDYLWFWFERQVVAWNIIATKLFFAVASFLIKCESSQAIEVLCEPHISLSLFHQFRFLGFGIHKVKGFETWKHIYWRLVCQVPRLFFAVSWKQRKLRIATRRRWLFHSSVCCGALVFICRGLLSIDINRYRALHNLLCFLI